MGHGSYTSSDWAALRKSAGISHTSTANQIFTKKQIESGFDPKGIALRESRDSDDHPNSTPVIIGLDVTGSMGYLAEEIAKNSLNETMTKLYDLKPVPDPQLMFAAIGDVVDQAPLQVTQFESDIRIAKQLLSLWLEGKGGDSPEDYPLLWYFADKHTATDSWAKRHKPGYLITIGDADCHKYIEGHDIQRIFGDPDATSLELSANLAARASERYELFHIHLTSSMAFKPLQLQAALPGRVILLKKTSVNLLPELIISLLQVVNGMDVHASARQWGEHAGEISECLKNLRAHRTGQGYSF